MILLFSLINQQQKILSSTNKINSIIKLLIKINIVAFFFLGVSFFVIRCCHTRFKILCVYLFSNASLKKKNTREYEPQTNSTVTNEPNHTHIPIKTHKFFNKNILIVRMKIKILIRDENHHKICNISFLIVILSGSCCKYFASGWIQSIFIHLFNMNAHRFKLFWLFRLR